MSLKLSPKHGVNPGITLCFYCQQPSGLALFGELPEDEQAPRHTTINTVPCQSCESWMEKGIILISVRDSDMHSENPYRTGGWAVVKEEAFKMVIEDSPNRDFILSKRFAYVPDSVWKLMGLEDNATN